MPVDNRVYTLPNDALRSEFLASLADDLRLLNHAVDVHQNENGTEFAFRPNDFNSLGRDEIGALYRRIRNRQLLEDEAELNFIRKMEADDVLDLFIDGQDLQIDQIEPEVRIADSSIQKDIYRYCRNLQTIPTSSGVGRRFSALVYDVGQEKEVLMGAIGLAGTTYSLRDRDNYFKWTDIDSRSEQKQVKDVGLKHIMQLSVCMAVEPYNYLCATRLIALLAFSTPIQEEFQQRYEDHFPLLALVTTSATHLHAPIFTRIHPNRLEPKEEYENYSSLLFRRVGETSEYSTIMLCNRTVELAKRLVGAVQPTDGNDTENPIRMGLSKGQLITRALRLCGLDKEVIRTNRRGLFVGCLHPNNLAILRREAAPEEAVLTLDVRSATEYWKKALKARCERSTDRLNKLQTFKCSELALTKQLEEESTQ